MPASPEPRPGGRERIGIPVDAQHLRALRREAPPAWPPWPRVASTTRRAPAAGGQDLGEQDGLVERLGVAGVMEWPAKRNAPRPRRRGAVLRGRRG